MKKLCVVLVAMAVAAGAAFAQGITLEQNKPEIDAFLKAYAATWSQANNVPVTIKSIGGGSQRS